MDDRGRRAREAWAEIRAKNRFNDPPEEGFEHWIVPVTATYLGDETGNAAWDLTVEFVSFDPGSAWHPI